MSPFAQLCASPAGCLPECSGSASGGGGKQRSFVAFARKGLGVGLAFAVKGLRIALAGFYGVPVWVVRNWGLWVGVWMLFKLQMAVAPVRLNGEYRALSWGDSLTSQRTQYPLIKEYTLNNRGLNII